MIVHKTSAIGLTELPSPGRGFLQFTGRVNYGDFARAGLTEARLNYAWYRQQNPRVVNLKASLLSLSIAAAIQSM